MNEQPSAASLSDDRRPSSPPYPSQAFESQNGLKGQPTWELTRTLAMTQIKSLLHNSTHFRTTKEIQQPSYNITLQDLPQLLWRPRDYQSPKVPQASTQNPILHNIAYSYQSLKHYINSKRGPHRKYGHGIDAGDEAGVLKPEVLSSHESRNPSKMHYQPIVHLIRHASALRPASQRRSDLEAFHDPELSPAGIVQCETFRANFKDDSQYITHVLSSPLRRSLETARLAFKDILGKHIKIVPMPELQSCEGGPNSTGHSVLELKKQYEAAEETSPAGMEGGEMRPQFYWRYMREDWTEGKQNRDDGLWGWDQAQWRKNHMKGFLRGITLTKKPEEKMEILVVGHVTFLKKLVIGFDGDRTVPAWTAGTQIRSFKFDNRGELEEVNKEELNKLRKGNAGDDE